MHDTQGCSQTATFEISQPAELTIQGVVTDVSCAGGSDGRVQVVISGGHGVGIPFTYEWYRYGTTGWELIPGADTDLLRDVTAGRYRVS